MSRSSLLWNRPHLTRGDVPTLHDMLCCCDKPLLARLVAEEVREGLSEPRSAPASRADERRASQAVDALCAMPAHRRRGRAWVVVPRERFTLCVRRCECVIERRVESAVMPFPRDDAVHDDLDSVASGEVNRLAFAPLDEALAYRVWCEGEWCGKERYLMLAHAVAMLARLKEAGKGGVRSDAVACAGAPHRGGLGLAHAPDEGACGRTVSEEQARRAQMLGLALPDPVEEAYRMRLIDRVACLNDEAARAAARVRGGLEKRLRAA